MKISLHTLGCKVNQYETEAIRELFEQSGHTVTTEPNADAVIINSCTVTAESDRKTRQLVRRCRRENPDAVIVLTGCMVQAFPKDAAALSEADIILGNADHEKIVTLTEAFRRNGERVIEVTPHETGEPYHSPDISDFSERTRAYMKIEDGCDRFCSYCIIPTARGRVRSRRPDDIRAETERLAAKGFREIVLVGINLSAYGKDTADSLPDAVANVAAVDGIRRVRLGSLEPDHITDEMLTRLAAIPEFCPQFHLSLQSGCDATLRRMNRHYDTVFYLDLVNRIRTVFPDAAITTDIMVGFAGETPEEFAESIDFVKQVGFAKSHVFAYSRRAGTVAAALKSQVSNAEKEARSREMIAVTRALEEKFLHRQCGQVFPVLFEQTENGFAEGYTPNYSRVLVKTDESHTGQILPVRLISAEGDHCVGELVENGNC